MVTMIIEKLYRQLKKFTIFNFLLVLICLINTKYLHFIIDIELISLIVTVISIIFGFLVSAICNLYGRNITTEMSEKVGKFDKGKSQLQELKYDFSIILYISVLIMLSAFFGFIIKNSELKTFFFSNMNMIYCLSAFYIWITFFLFFSLLHQINILLAMLVNESYLEKRKK